MPNEADLKAAIWDYYDTCWHKGDFSIVDRFAPSFGQCGNNLWDIDGPEGIKTSMRRLRSGLNGLSGEITDWFFDLGANDPDIGPCDRVTIWWTIHGTFSGEMMGIAPTGKPVTITGASLLWLVDGKLVAARASSDIYQALGALPKAA